MSKFYKQTSYKGMVDLVFKNLDIHFDWDCITPDLYCHLGNNTFITLDINNLYTFIFDGDGETYKIYGRVILEKGYPFLSKAVELGEVEPDDYADFISFDNLMEPQLKDWVKLLNCIRKQENRDIPRE